MQVIIKKIMSRTFMHDSHRWVRRGGKGKEEKKNHNKKGNQKYHRRRRWKRRKKQGQNQKAHYPDQQSHLGIPETAAGHYFLRQSTLSMSKLAFLGRRVVAARPWKKVGLCYGVVNLDTELGFKPIVI